MSSKQGKSDDKWWPFDLRPLMTVVVCLDCLSLWDNFIVHDFMNVQESNVKLLLELFCQDLSLHSSLNPLESGV